MDYQGSITIVPGKRSGKPRIRDTRITVYDIQPTLLFAADGERKLISIEA